MCSPVYPINFRDAALISPDALDAEGSWDTALFLQSQALPFIAGSGQPPLRLRAQVFEGARPAGQVSKTERDRSYPASSLSPFELSATRGHWHTPEGHDVAAVQPGDVVIKRISPVAAAVVPPGLPALPADPNFFVIRGLDQPHAWWLGFLINYPPCADYLISKSGRGVLGRVSLSVLRNLPLPEPPPEFSRLARRLSDILQKRTFLARQFAALETEVETMVADQMATTTLEDAEEHFTLRSWTFWFAASLLDGSWLPLHVAAQYRSAMLRRDSDWRPLRTFLLPDPPSRLRFAQGHEAIPVLRLSDMTDIPLVPPSLPATVPAQFNRIFREPIQPGEVLLSTLASQSRVAFAPVPPQPSAFAVDHWERLRFPDYAAAYALILQTGVVARQLRSLASGSVQQFVRSEDIRDIYLPILPEQILSRWDRTFRSLSHSWHQTDAQWQDALRDGWQNFAQAHNLPPAALPAHLR